MDSGRHAILEGTYAKSLCPQLRCDKNLRADIFDGNNEANTKDTMKSVSEAASCKEWRLHHDGTSPQTALQREEATEAYGWNKKQWVIAIVGVGIAVAALIISISNC